MSHGVYISRARVRWSAHPSLLSARSYFSSHEETGGADHLPSGDPHLVLRIAGYPPHDGSLSRGSLVRCTFGDPLGPGVFCPIPGLVNAGVPGLTSTRSWLAAPGSMPAACRHVSLEPRAYPHARSKLLITNMWHNDPGVKAVFREGAGDTSEPQFPSTSRLVRSARGTSPAKACATSHGCKRTVLTRHPQRRVMARLTWKEGEPSRRRTILTEEATRIVLPRTPGCPSCPCVFVSSW